jgi:hypothetical protein
LLCSKAAELGAQRLVAFGGAVLQRAARLLGQCLLAGFAQALDVEHGAVGKATGEADDAGLAQQLEQLPDGGGFDVVEAGGELHGKDSLLNSRHCRAARHAGHARQ